MLAGTGDPNAKMGESLSNKINNIILGYNSKNKINTHESI